LNNWRSGHITIRNPFPTDPFTIPAKTSNIKETLGGEVDVAIGATRAHINDLDKDLGSRGTCLCTVDKDALTATTRELHMEEREGKGEVRGGMGWWCGYIHI
jgi:hypothetical protein